MSSISKTCGNCADFPCDASGAHLRGDPACGFYKQVPEKDVKEYSAPGEEAPEFMDGKRFVPKILGDIILGEYSIVTFPDSLEMAVYKQGVFNLASGEQIIQEVITDKLGEYFQKNRLHEVVTYLQISTYTNREEMNTNTYLINVKNGMYDVRQDELLQHDPKYKSTIQLNVTWVREAECTTISKFLSEVTTLEGQAKVIQYAGYCCTPDIKYQRTLLIDGPQQNGKSTVLEMICHMIGKWNTSQQSLQSLNEDRFAREQLNNKLINFYGDLPAKKLYDNSVFKMLTSDKYIDGEKKYGQKFRYKNTIHQMYALNKVPELSDPDEMAFFRRLICVTFPTSFEGKADRNLLDKITREEEISGFFNMAMAGLRILLEKDEFCYNKTVEEIQKEYLNKSNPVVAFLDECTEYSDGEISKKGLYETFLEWCTQNNITTTPDINPFSALIKKLGYEDYRTGTAPREYRWCNISYIAKGIEIRPSNGNGLDAYNPYQETQTSERPTINHILSYTNIKDIIYSGYVEKDVRFGRSLGRIDHITQSVDLTEDVHGSCVGRTSSDGSQRDTVNFIRATIKNLQVDGKTPIAAVLDHAIENGIAFDKCRAAINHMKADGSIFIPTDGFYKCI